MRTHLPALALGYLLSLAIADPADGGACGKYSLYNCAAASAFDDAEMAEFERMGKRDVTLPLDPRTIDFSTLDEETGFNVSNLLRRKDLEGLSAGNLHARISEVLSDPDVALEGGADISKKFELMTRAGGREPYSICKMKVVEDGKTKWVKKSEMSYYCPGYPNGNTLFDNADWSDCNNFALEVKPGSTAPQASRKHIDEHILEKNMIQQFSRKVLEVELWPDQAEADKPVAEGGTGKRTDEVTQVGTKEKEPETRVLCEYLKHYWDHSGTVKNVDGHKVWDFVGNAWPQNNDAGAAEMVRTDSEMNGIKTLLFQMGKSISAKKKTQQRAEDIDQVHHIIAKLKLGVLLVKYMDHPKVNAIYYTQAVRVSAAFEAAENGIEQNFADGKNGPPYKKLGLREKWMAFMDTYTDEVIIKLSDWMKELLVYIKDHVETGKKDPGVAKMDNDRKELHKRMEEIVKQVEGLTGVGKPPLFKNPFKPGAAPPKPEESSSVVSPVVP
ncbi:hypothetical protein ACHAQA_003132 [Verticillium albo-atrum]